MIIVFALLTLLGILQLFLFIRQQQRTASLHRTESQQVGRKRLQFLQRYSFGKKFSAMITDVQSHIMGRQRSVFLLHVVVIILMQGGFLYLNAEYIQLEPLIVQPVVLLLTTYALYLRSKKKMRQQFESTFSEALNVINSSLRAGNSVIQGIGQCGQKLEGILGEEFRQVAQRLEIGESPESVFMDSWKRLPYREYYFFIVTVLINMKGGGQIREVMSRLSSLISSSRIMERKKYAMTSEARMSVKILAAIPIGFLIFINFQSPQNMDILLHNPTGQIIFYYSVGSILFGLFVVWLMMNKI